MKWGKLATVGELARIHRGLAQQWVAFLSFCWIAVRAHIVPAH